MINGGLNRICVSLPYVFVHKSGVGAFPCCDATATVAEREETRLDPRRAESIQEVRLTCDLVLVEVGITKFSYVYLFRIDQLLGVSDPRIRYSPCLGRNRNRRSRSQC
jgi:hypothetical protein